MLELLFVGLLLLSVLMERSYQPELGKICSVSLLCLVLDITELSSTLNIVGLNKFNRYVIVKNDCQNYMVYLLVFTISVGTCAQKRADVFSCNEALQFVALSHVTIQEV